MLMNIRNAKVGISARKTDRMADNLRVLGGKLVFEERAVGFPSARFG